MKIVEENYQRWLNSPLVNHQMKETLKEMSQEEKEDAFFKNVEFGTAGMRGVLGPGTNRLNSFTVKKATVAFAIYLLEKYDDICEKGVVISHDNRHMSREFTLITAKVFNEFGIKAYIFDGLRPTPELSFAVRYLNARGGVMITASHNPKQYNGYKVYDDTGCQLVPSKIHRLLEIIDSLPNELDVTYCPSINPGELIILDESIDEEYVKLVESIVINNEISKKDFKIVFTPNHGTAYVNAMKVFNDLGYEIYPLLSQCDPDPDFSNTLSPNPEDELAYIEPLKYAKEIGAKLVVMTDPDGDRVGLAYLDRNGEYQLLNGNVSGAMLMDYIFHHRKEKGLLSEDGVMYNTIVTSSIGEKVASYYGVKTESFLTGFKYIGNRIAYYEKHGGPKFEFGYEESYGCLISPFARDKDGLQAITLYSEMANYYDKQGKTLDVVWDEICKRLGYHEDKVYSINFFGPIGAEKMKNLMDILHNNPDIEINGNKVKKVEDFLKRTTTYKNKVTPIDLDVSDVVKLTFVDDTVIAVRPSGTEPKVKFYVGAVAKEKEELIGKCDKLYNEMKKVLNLD